MAATRTPSGNGLTTWRSPHWASPGRASVATPHSITDLSLFPFFGRHRGPNSDVGDDFKLIHESPDTCQAKPQAARCRVASRDGAPHISDSRPLVASHHHHTPPDAVLHCGHDDFALHGIEDDVPR